MDTLRHDLTIALLAAQDTKSADADFLRLRFSASGVRVMTIDIGVLSDPAAMPDYPASHVAMLGGTPLAELRSRRDRSEAVAVMAAGAMRLLDDLHSRGLIDGVLAIGGGAGTTIGATAMRNLPLGLPKVLLSTVAAGDTSGYVGTSDIVMFPSLVDIAGLNRISQLTYTAAADALVGMVNGRAQPKDQLSERPVIAASMFGVTTPAVLHAKELLEAEGFEVLVFHATGAGGRTLERLCAEGYFAAVLDLTTTEWADQIVGGILSAGPDRLKAAAQAGVPQLVSVGATDMVNFGHRHSLPSHLIDRTLYEHNAENTLMRTDPAEAALIGTAIGQKVRQSIGPATVLIPDGGVSALDAPGQPFEDLAARSALTAALEDALIGSPVRVRHSPAHINDPGFAALAVQELLALLSQKVPS